MNPFFFIFIPRRQTKTRGEVLHAQTIALDEVGLGRRRRMCQDDKTAQVLH